TGTDHTRGPQQAVSKPVTAASLAQDNPFGKLIARLMRNRLVQVWIESFAFRLDWLQSILGQEIVELFENESHSGINRRLFAFSFGSFQTKLKIINNCHQPLK